MSKDIDSLKQLMESWAIDLEGTAQIFSIPRQELGEFLELEYLPGRYSTQLSGLLDIDFLLREQQRSSALAIREPHQDLGGKNILQELQERSSVFEILELLEHREIVPKLLGAHNY